MPIKTGDIVQAVNVCNGAWLGKIIGMTQDNIVILWSNGNSAKYNKNSLTLRRATKAEILLYWPSPDPEVKVFHTHPENSYKIE